jgi:hypothetical protein
MLMLEESKMVLMLLTTESLDWSESRLNRPFICFRSRRTDSED